jgi:hypothetical protein
MRLAVLHFAGFRAVVLYLSLATIFASDYAVIWEFSPSTFANLVAIWAARREIGIML